MQLTPDISRQWKKVDKISWNKQINILYIILAYSRSSLISSFFFFSLLFFKQQQVVIELILDFASFTQPTGMMSSLLRMLLWSKPFRGYHDKHLATAWDSKQPSFPYVLHCTALFHIPKYVSFYVANKLQNIREKKRFLSF